MYPTRRSELLRDQPTKEPSQFVLADADIDSEELELRELLPVAKPRFRVRREDDLRHAADANHLCVDVN